MNLIDRLSDLAVRHLPVERYDALRGFYLGLRRRVAPAMRLVYGSFDTADLRAHLDRRLLQNGARDFEILMVHSSVNAMAPMYTGNAVEFVRMLVDWCGPERTLVMPAFYFGDPKQGGAAATFRRDPHFDLRRTPSQMGLATEIFRRFPGVRHSRHPVYRVSALGPLAAALTAGHEHARSPSGPGTPFEFMAAHDTLILGIGKSFEVMTQVHHVDDLLGDEFPVPRRAPTARDALVVEVKDGEERFPVTLRGNRISWRFDIARLPRLVQPGDLERWRFHQVPMFAARARTITDRLIAAARTGRTLYEPQ